MSTLRWLGMALITVGVIAALVPILGLAGPQEVPVRGTPVVAAPSPVSVQQDGPQPDDAESEPESDAESDDGSAEDARPAGGPDLNERSREANQNLQRNKLVVGAVAAGLLGIVIMGRRARSSRRNKS